MMDRIEDETIRFLFFVQSVRSERREDDDLGGAPEPTSAPAAEDRKEAQSSFVDLTRKILRKKDREMEMLQFTGCEASATPAAQVIKGDKTGRNDPCPCGSGKKYKKCHGS